MRLSFFKIWQNKKIYSPTVCQMRLVFLAACHRGPPRAYLYTCLSYSVSHPMRRRLPSPRAWKNPRHHPTRGNLAAIYLDQSAQRFVHGCVLPRRVKRKHPLEIGFSHRSSSRVLAWKAIVPPRVKEPPHEGCPREACRRRRDQVGWGDGQLERRDRSGGDGRRDRPTAAPP